MPSWLDRLRGGSARLPETKAKTQTLFRFSPLGLGGGTRKGFATLANEGFARNPVVYRCVRMLAENAARVPLEVRDGDAVLSEHKLLSLLRRPNRRQDGIALIESLVSYLLLAGNAYLDAAIVEGEVKGLYGLRPDRMAVIAGKDGWPIGYAYSVGGRTQKLMLDGEGGAELAVGDAAGAAPSSVSGLPARSTFSHEGRREEGRVRIFEDGNG